MIWKGLKENTPNWSYIERKCSLKIIKGKERLKVGLGGNLKAFLGKFLKNTVHTKCYLIKLNITYT